MGSHRRVEEYSSWELIVAGIVGWVITISLVVGLLWIIAWLIKIAI